MEVNRWTGGRSAGWLGRWHRMEKEGRIKEQRKELKPRKKNQGKE